MFTQLLSVQKTVQYVQSYLVSWHNVQNPSNLKAVCIFKRGRANIQVCVCVLMLAM